MGLDWMLNKLKPKSDDVKEEFSWLIIKDELTAEEEKRLDAISTSIYEVIGAPRVRDCPEWFREHQYLPMQERVAEEKAKPAGEGWDCRNQTLIDHWSRPFEELLAEHGNRFVLDLATDKEGFAAVSGLMCSDLDFRGKVIGWAEFLPRKLRDEAYEDHDAAACVDYANRLEAAVEAYRKAHPNETRTPDNDNLEEICKTVLAGVKWLRYWGSRGFGYSSWF